MQLFKSTVEKMLLYSCEALAITDTMAKNLDASHRALMRYSLGVHFPVRLSNKDLYSRTCITPATTTLLRSRLRLIGHALRRPEVPLATFLNPQNQPSEPFRQGGSLRCTYISQLIDDLNAIGLQHDQAVQAALDRPGWHRRISNIGQTCGHNVSSRVWPE